MCGIALTLAYTTQQTEAASAAAASSSSSLDAVTATAAHWSAVAEAALTPRGPDVQRSLPLSLPSGVAASLTATVLHLRGASSTPTAQPLCDPAGSGNVICWNGELYALCTERLPEPMRAAGQQAWPQIATGQNDTAFVMALLCRLDRECGAEEEAAAASAGAAYAPAASAASSSCGDFGTQLSWLLSAIDGPFSFVFYRARFGQLWYGRDKLGRRSLVTAQRSCADAAGEEMHVLHLGSVTLQPQTHNNAADGSQWAEVGVTGVWCIQLHGAAQSRDAAAVEAAVASAAALAASAAAASVALAPSPSPSAIDPEDGPAIACAPAAVPAVGAPFTLLHYPYPHLHAHLGSAASAATPSAATAADSAAPPAAAAVASASAASSSQLPLPCVARLAHSYATGVQLAADIAPFERPHGRATPQQLEALAASAQELNASIPTSMHGLPPAAKMLYAALHRSMALRLHSICTPPSASAARVGILFSGGLDCMVLAFLAHRLLPRDEPVDLINVAFAGHLSAAAVEKFVPDRVTAINGWRELKHVSAREASGNGTEASASSASVAVGSSISPSSSQPSSARRWNLILVDVSLSMLESHRSRILALLHPRDTVMDFNIASILYFGSRAKGRLHEDPVAAATAGGQDGQRINVSTSEMNDSTEPATVEMIQSRLSRLGTTKAAVDSAPASDSAASAGAPGSSSLRSKPGKKAGRVLPPELLAKIAAGGGPTTASFAHSQAKDAAAAMPAASDAMEAAPSSSPDTDAGADDVSSAASQSAALPPSVPLTKSDRRSAKNRERNLIRKFFKAQASESIRQDMEDMMPSADDFRSAEDVAAEVAAAAAGNESVASGATFTSHAKVLLLGIGADELMAGYGRHRTVWINAARGGAGARRERSGGKSQQGLSSSAVAAASGDASNAASSSPSPDPSAGSFLASPSASPSPSPGSSFDADEAGWSSLRAELARDFHRLWVRNLGRDDRVIADSGREARHPFLDESLLALMHHTIPLECVASMQQPAGVGDKMILRQVAAALGLQNASRLVKRAMQFGARIANKKVAGYVRMDSADAGAAPVRCEDVVNPFFLRAETVASSSGAATGAGVGVSVSASCSSAPPSDRPFVSLTPHANLDKRVQKANKKMAHARAAAAATAAAASSPCSASPPEAAASSSSAPYPHSVS